EHAHDDLAICQVRQRADLFRKPGVGLQAYPSLMRAVLEPLRRSAYSRPHFQDVAIQVRPQLGLYIRLPVPCVSKYLKFSAHVLEIRYVRRTLLLRMDSLGVNHFNDNPSDV